MRSSSRWAASFRSSGRSAPSRRGSAPHDPEPDPPGLRAVARGVDGADRRAVATGLQLALPEPPRERDLVGALLRLGPRQRRLHHVAGAAPLELLARLDAALARPPPRSRPRD